jgi:FkbM family methyltransferase
MKRVAQDQVEFGRFAPRGWKAALIAVTRRCSDNWSGKRAAFFLRGAALRLMRGRPIDVQTLGVSMRLYPYGNTCEKRLLFTPQFFDHEEREFLIRGIGPDFVFIDVGASVGGYSLFVASKAGPRSRVLAVEPQPEIFERLVYNIQQNAFTIVKAVDCAVADKPGEITLFVAARNVGETSMKVIDADSYDRRIRVVAKTLKQLVEDEGFDHIDAIKIDAQGAEDLILEPYFLTAPQHLWPKVLLVEDRPAGWSVDIEKMLMTCGYKEGLRTRLNRGWVRE